MKSPLTIVVLGLLCAVCAGVSWHLAGLEQQIASTGVLLLTLKYEAAGINARNTTSILAPGNSLEAGQLRASADYWSQQYDQLTQSGQSTGTSTQRDPEQMFMASNARYRQWQMHREKESREASIEELQSVIKAYADVVKSQPQNEDAAYNYEFAVRQGEILSATGKPAMPEASSGQLSLHGRSGAAPKASGTNPFKIIVPQQPDERKEDPSAGKGQKITKKG
jgi:hypothetical protein